MRAHLKKKTGIDLSDSRFRTLIKRATPRAKTGTTAQYFEQAAEEIRKMVGV